MPSIIPKTSATGGVIELDITLTPGLDPNSATIQVQRFTGSLSATPTLIYNGVFAPIVLDDGEQLPNYLDNNTAYFYRVTDSSGSATTSGIVPQASFSVFSNYLDRLLFRLFASGINSVVVPAGFQKIRVLEAMPLTQANELLPLIVLNLDLEQQEEVQIGQAVPNTLENNTIIPTIVYRRYSISILTRNAKERDFYKDATIGVVYAITSVLTNTGNIISLRYQVAQSQVSTSEELPGFYEAQVMLDLSGQFNIIISTNLPLIQGFTSTVSAVSGAVSSNIFSSSGIISSIQL